MKIKVVYTHLFSIGKNLCYAFLSINRKSKDSSENKLQGDYHPVDNAGEFLLFKELLAYGVAIFS